MDDQSGTLFAAVLTVIGVTVLLTVLLAILPFVLLGLLVWIVGCLIYAGVKAEGGELESQPPERP